MPRIFIIDDSISVRKALEITFKKHAIESVSAVSAEQALELLQGTNARFDLIMADVIMPGMSGLELCSTLRQQARFQRVPIILMSGNIDEDIRNQAIEVGADGVLRKPFSPDELIPMVEELLQREAASTAQENAASQDATGQNPATVSTPPTAPMTVEPVSVQAAPAATTPPEEDPDDIAPLAPEPMTPEPVSPESMAPAPQPTFQQAASQLETERSATPQATDSARPPAETQHADHLNDLQVVLEQYQRRTDVEDLMVLDPQFNVAFHSKATLTDSIASYTRFFVSTARVIGGQLPNAPLLAVTLHYLGKNVTFHIVHEFTVIVLTNSSQAAH